MRWRPMVFSRPGDRLVERVDGMVSGKVVTGVREGWGRRRGGR